MAEVCPRCGGRYSAQGISSHIGSYACQLQADQRRAREENLVPAGNLRRQLEAAGVPMKDLYSGMIPGYKRQRTKLRVAAYAPAWAVKGYRALRASGCSPSECVRVLAEGPDSPRLLAALAMEAIGR